MTRRFTRHYTREEASALLPEIRDWLARLRRLQPVLEKQQRALQPLLARGHDVGGALVRDFLRTLADAQNVLAEFARRQIQLKDLDRGLVDFPAIVAGREVFLCWEEGEPAVEYWHDLDAGYAGRSPLQPGA
jgi:hypothetical protein